MKKVCFLLALFVPISAMAGVYIQGNIGSSELYMKHQGENYRSGSQVSYGVTVGATTGQNGRVAIDYTSFAEEKDTEVEKGLIFDTSSEGKFKARSVGVSYIYDFKGKSAITPYVGARVGFTQLDLKTQAEIKNRLLGSYQENIHLRDTLFGVGGIVGVQYQIAPKVALDLATEYNYFGKSEIFGDAEFDQVGIKAGMRADF